MRVALATPITTSSDASAVGATGVVPADADRDRINMDGLANNNVLWPRELLRA